MTEKKTGIVGGAAGAMAAFAARALKNTETRDSNGAGVAPQVDSASPVHGGPPLNRNGVVSMPMQFRHEVCEVRVIDDGQRTVELSFSSAFEVERYFGFERLSHDPQHVDLTRLLNGAPLLHNHRHAEQIGVVESATIDAVNEVGRAVVRFSKNGLGAEIYEDVKDGIRRNVSVGYRYGHMTLIEVDGNDNERWLIDDWQPFEISIVSVPADFTVGVGRDYAGRQFPVTVDRAGFGATTEEGDEPMNIRGIGGGQDDATNGQPANGGNQNANNGGQNRGNGDGNQNRGNDNGGDNTNASGGEANRSAGGELPTRTSIVPSVDAKRARDEERTRVAGIMEHCRNHSIDDAQISTFINEGRDLAHVREEVMAIREQRMNDAPSPANVRFDRGDEDRFSLGRAIQAMDSGDWDDAGLEREASQEIASRVGRKTRGIFMPLNAFSRAIHRHDAYRTLGVSQRAPLDTTTAGGAAELVGTDHLAESFIELLRPVAVLTRLGARTLPGLRGDVDIPRQIGAASVTWIGEDDATVESNLQTGSLNLAPKTVSGKQTVTRKLLLQSAPAIDAMVTADLLLAMALGVDLVGLDGGGANEPTGIMQTLGVGHKQITAGAPTWADIVDLEALVDTANGLDGSLGYVSNANFRGLLKQTPKVAGQDTFIMGERAEVNGYQHVGSNQLANDTVLFGDYSTVMFAEWGVLEIVPDPYEKADDGGLVVRSFQDLDVGIRHPGKLAFGDINP